MAISGPGLVEQQFAIPGDDAKFLEELFKTFEVSKSLLETNSYRLEL